MQTDPYKSQPSVSLQTDQPESQPSGSLQTDQPKLSQETSGSSSGHKKKANPLILTTQQKDDMSNPCIFKQKMSEYMNSERKNRLWAKKADELSVEMPLLKTWFKSMRMRYCKLTKAKSGDRAAEHTDHDKWIIAQFKFIHTHTVGGLQEKLAAKAVSTANPSQDGSEDDEEEEKGDSQPVHLRSVTPDQPASPVRAIVPKSSSSDKGPAVKSTQTSRQGVGVANA